MDAGGGASATTAGSASALSGRFAGDRARRRAGAAEQEPGAVFGRCARASDRAAFVGQRWLTVGCYDAAGRCRAVGSAFARSRGGQGQTPEASRLRGVFMAILHVSRWREAPPGWGEFGCELRCCWGEDLAQGRAGSAWAGRRSSWHARRFFVLLDSGERHICRPVPRIAAIEAARSIRATLRQTGFGSRLAHQRVDVMDAGACTCSRLARMLT